MQHVARFLAVWLGTLPFALVATLGWQAIPTMAIISFILIGIDEIALQVRRHRHGRMGHTSGCTSVKTLSFPDFLARWSPYVVSSIPGFLVTSYILLMLSILPNKRPGADH